MSAPRPRPLAVVTGASRGIGLELARECARDGHDLLITGRGEATEEAAGRLREYGAAVTAVTADLATADGVEHVVRAVHELGRPVDVLALNAGLGLGGRFLGGPEGTDLDDELTLIGVNVTATVVLAKKLVPPMAERGRGRVLVTASISGTTPTTFEAVYGASKAFQRSFAEALREELRDTGVTVTALLPGPTDTDFFARGNMDDTRVGVVLKSATSAASVARQGYVAMMAGRHEVVGGSRRTRLQRQLNKVLPDPVKARRHRAIAEPGTG